MSNKILSLGILIIMVCISCNDENVGSLNMGEEYIDGESGIVLYDTLGLELSTVLIDSISMSESGVALVGSYYDDVFGSVNSEAVYRVNLPESTPFEEDDVFDSITICMLHNNYYLGDTSQLFTIRVSELATDLEDIDQTYFYNTTRVSKKEESLGELSYYPRPKKGEEVEFKLDNDFGLELFNLFLDDADEVSGADDFKEYFKGIVLNGDENINKSVIGYTATDTCMYLKMYYHRTEDYTKDLDVKFKLESSTKYQFNSITSDRSGTYIESLIEQSEDIPSVESDNKSFIQGSTGLMTKIKFPGLADVFQRVLINQIIKAELILEPTKKTNDINDLPDALLVYESNNVNALNDVLTTDDESSIIYMTRQDKSYDYEETSYYSIDITSYIINELLDGYFNSDFALLVGLMSEDQSGTITSLIIGGEKDADYTPKIKLYTYYY